MTETIRDKLRKFAPVQIGKHTENLTAEENAIVEKLVDACRQLEPVFWKQCWSGSLALRERLSKKKSDRDKLHYVMINAGPFERVRENRPFIGKTSKPPGAGFYPDDLTKKQFENYVTRHPEVREAFMSPFTVIRREGKKLVAVPYHVAYAEHVEPAAALLREAAGMTRNPSLTKYLNSRADGLLTDDYFQSDCDWIDLQGTPLDVVIGPYEVYEDHLLSIKATYEGVVMVTDQAESRKLDVYVSHLEQMEQNLPIPERYKSRQKGLAAPMTVVNDLYRSGDIRHGYQAVAFSLPNDPKVHELKGAKKVMHKNFMDARLEKVIVPLASKLLDRGQLELVTPQGYFDFVVLHEISHTLGPRQIQVNGSATTVNEALKECYPAIEEAKADVCSLHTLPYLIQQGVLPAAMEHQYPASYLGGLFRSVRFGTAEAHGKAEMMIFNFLVEAGGIRCDTRAKRFVIDEARFKQGIEKLAGRLLTIEAEGDYAGARAMLDGLGVLRKDLGGPLAALKRIPIDFEPFFAWAD